MIEYFNEDCMTGMARYPDKYFDLAIVDPPYGVDIGNGLGSGTKNIKMHKTWQMNAPNEEYFQELFRVSKNQIIWGGNYFDLPNNDDWIIWDKLNPNLTFAEAELAWCSIERKIRIFKKYSAIIDGGCKIHPTQKPIALYKWLLTNYAKQGDNILDTHVGSASSLIACHDMGFDAVGFELDPDYYAKSKQRLEDFMRQPRIDTIEQQQLEQLML